MNAPGAELCCDQSPATVACSAPMAPCHARRFSNLAGRNAANRGRESARFGAHQSWPAGRAEVISFFHVFPALPGRLGACATEQTHTARLTRMSAPRKTGRPRNGDRARPVRAHHGHGMESSAFLKTDIRQFPLGALIRLPVLGSAPRAAPAAVRLSRTRSTVIVTSLPPQPLTPTWQCLDRTFRSTRSGRCKSL
jgi:hypothetical protein